MKNYEYRCLICDYTWESDKGLNEVCPKCGEYNDVFAVEPENKE